MPPASGRGIAIIRKDVPAADWLLGGHGTAPASAQTLACMNDAVCKLLIMEGLGPADRSRSSRARRGGVRDLAGQGLEEGGRPHDGVRNVACRLQRGLELELGMLELQQRLLHADRAQQHEVGRPRCPRRVQHVQRRLVVDGPRVFLRGVRAVSHSRRGRKRDASKSLACVPLLPAAIHASMKQRQKWRLAQ